MHLRGFLHFTKKEKPVAAATVAASPVQAAIPNKGEFAAAVAAAIAEDLGTDVTGIRIKSIKKYNRIERKENNENI